MFVSSRDAGVRRQNRTYNNNNKASRSSKISLLSTFTLTTTSSSGGSNNTISQDSYNRSQHKHRRKRQHRSRRPEPSYHNPSVDVFDFLVEEKSQSDERLPEGGAEDSDDSEDEAERPEPNLVVHLDEAEPEGYYRSMSDSGISMTSSASGHSPKKRLPVVIEEMPGQAEQHSGREIALIDPGGKWPPYSPQPYPEGFIPPPCPPPPPAVVYDVPIYPYQPYPSYSTPPLPAEGNPGPLITIREPSQQLTKPKCFRTFNKVSTRLLLQMQDEIAELENELKSLDEENDLAEKLEDRSSAPARDRTNREADVYEELHFKLDNYYHLLEMMHKVDSISQPAVTSDLAKYHKWLESRIRQGSRVRQLVGNDLRRFSEGDKEKPEPTRTFQPQYLAYCCLINAVIPLILLKIIKGVLNRLILLSLIVVAGSIAQDRMRTTISRDELTCTLVCICISAFAAIFL